MGLEFHTTWDCYLKESNFQTTVFVTVWQVCCQFLILWGILGHADDASANAKPSSKEEEQMRSERGVQFLIGNSFYRKESAVGRDLGVLAAAVLKREKGQLHVLDALCGSGVRAARYLAQAQADFVWANDACDSLKPLITHNLSLAATAAAASNSNSQSVVSTSNAKEIESVVCELCSLFSSFNGWHFMARRFLWMWWNSEHYVEKRQMIFNDLLATIK